MFKKTIIFIVVLAFLGVAFIPLWTTRMAEEAFKNPTWKIAPESVRRAIQVKMFIYLFDDARKTAEKAVLYFPESEDMPYFIYNAAICAEKTNNTDAAIYWFDRFITKYPRHQWAGQAERNLTRLKNMKN